MKMWWTEQSLPLAQSFYRSTINMNADRQINTYETQRKQGVPYAHKNPSIWNTYKIGTPIKKLQNSKAKIL